MVDLHVFDDAPVPEYTLGTDCKVDELIDWFRTTYPEREDIGPEELYRAARDYVLIYC